MFIVDFEQVDAGWTSATKKNITIFFFFFSFLRGKGGGGGGVCDERATAFIERTQAAPGSVL